MAYREATRWRQTPPRPSLTRYIELLLGRDSWTQLRNWLGRSWGAGTFLEFWRYWNPVYGYYLYYYCYRPLRRLGLPRPPATLLTFVASGFFLHDIVAWALLGRPVFPFVTVVLGTAGLIVLLTGWLKLDLALFPAIVRVAANLGYLALSVGAGLVVRGGLSG
jgi:hypothetical protein